MEEALQTSKRQLKVSVRDLVEFSMRTGDLAFEYTGSSRSIEAIRIHQKIQKSRPDGYRAEVTVSRQIETESFFLTVSGRADGVFESGGIFKVEEIKSVTADVDRLNPQDHPLHWGQVQCYAAILGAERDARDVDLQLTYANLDNDRIRVFERRMPQSELEDFFGEMVEHYLKRAAMISRWGLSRDTTISQLDFPFAGYRPGQREMAVEAYRNIRDAGQLLVQAATGIGKTMGALFPAIKALPQTRADKIFYLTARTTGRLAAEDALAELRSAGLELKSLTLTAKDKICFEKDRDCSPEECDYARGHYDRINAAVDDLFGHAAFTRQADRIDSTPSPGLPL